MTDALYHRIIGSRSAPTHNACADALAETISDELAALKLEDRLVIYERLIDRLRTEHGEIEAKFTGPTECVSAADRNHGASI